MVYNGKIKKTTFLKKPPPISEAYLKYNRELRKNISDKGNMKKCLYPTNTQQHIFIRLFIRIFKGCIREFILTSDLMNVRSVEGF